VRSPRDSVYEAWLERNSYTTTLLYGIFIGILLPAFHWVLQPARVPVDSLPLRLVCSGTSAIVIAALVLLPVARKYAERLQFLQVVVTMAVIDMLVVQSNDHYLYIASALLVIIGAQNAFFRISSLAVAMSFGCLFFVLYSYVGGILWAPYSLTTIATFFTAYALAFIPASMHIRARESDIRSRLQALRATSELEEAHAITHLGKWTYNEITGETHCSAELMRILGLPLDTPPSAMADLYARTIHPDDRAMVDEAFARCSTIGHFTVDHRIVLGDGSVRWVQLSGKAEMTEEGRLVNQLGTVIDITARKEAEISLERLARYDPLTGLPNRSMLQEQLSETLWERKRANAQCAVLFLDLDRFKDVNDTLGHSVGDLLIKEVAGRIRSLLPAGTLVARWGGDEFVALLHEVNGEADVERSCRRVVHGLSTPFAIDSYEFAVTASIGVALFPRDGGDVETLIRNADTAMYAAKEAPAQRYAFFASQMHTVASIRHHIRNQLQTAIATSSLSLYYQPIIDTVTTQVVAAEALLRWIDADGRIHQPAEFISIAEDTGAIVPIGMWVIEQAARQAMAWRREGIPLSVSVNLSPRQLAHPDFSEMLANVLRATRVDPELLEVEITESGLVPNAAAVTGVLESIRSMGLRIAVDDFGTGYSAFSYLKQLPLDTLKIDRTFVDGIERDVDRSIAESIIDIAHKLRLSVTAEGVETRFQRKILSELGCDRLQGFDICKPLALEHFQDFARHRLAAS
jgi:diguanylate cyclase (GGDEF)-like protein